ncbi:MAG: virulence RhuM family protein [Prevotella sp.]|nr:virulence RhuM family protein [Prevotella sp.]
MGKHINNALKEELKGEPVGAKFATTAADGKIYQVEYFNLDMIMSVGYRVKSKRGIQFRRWSNKVLKQYMSITGAWPRDSQFQKLFEIHTVSGTVCTQTTKYFALFFRKLRFSSYLCTKKHSR